MYLNDAGRQIKLLQNQSGHGTINFSVTMNPYRKMDIKENTS